MKRSLPPGRRSREPGGASAGRRGVAGEHGLHPSRTRRPGRAAPALGPRPAAAFAPSAQRARRAARPSPGTPLRSPADLRRSTAVPAPWPRPAPPRPRPHRRRHAPRRPSGHRPRDARSVRGCRRRSRSQPRFRTARRLRRRALGPLCEALTDVVRDQQQPCDQPQPAGDGRCHRCVDADRVRRPALGHVPTSSPGGAVGRSPLTSRSPSSLSWAGTARHGPSSVMRHRPSS